MIQRSIHDAWWRLATLSRPQSFSDIVACQTLWAGSLVYRAAVQLRNLAYDRGWASQARLPCRVVSVGNLTVGGTGKTACTELIAKKLITLGRRVAILSRGYGGTQRDYWLQGEQGKVAVSGTGPMGDDGLADEPQLLAMHLDGVPIGVGARRDRTGQTACAQFAADTLVLDDGFQHRRLQRDCDIVLVHARMPLGGWALLPRGPMREPLASLTRADIVMMTKADEAFELLGALQERLRTLNPKATLVSAIHEPSQLLDGLTGSVHDPARLNGLRVGLLSSIGDPAGFDATVARLHATVLWHRTFPDHYCYRAADWASVLTGSQGTRPDAIVTTEKDWVRLKPLIMERLPERVPLWVLGIRMKLLDGEDALDDRLAGLYVR